MSAAFTAASRALRGLGSPPPAHALRLARTGAVLLLLLRSILGVASVSLGPRTPLGLGWQGTALLLAIVGALCTLDARILRERIFLANLGVAGAWVPGLGVAGALCAEAVVRMVLGVLGGHA